MSRMLLEIPVLNFKIPPSFIEQWTNFRVYKGKFDVIFIDNFIGANAVVLAQDFINYVSARNTISKVEF